MCSRQWLEGWKTFQTIPCTKSHLSSHSLTLRHFQHSEVKHNEYSLKILESTYQMSGSTMNHSGENSLPETQILDEEKSHLHRHIQWMWWAQDLSLHCLYQGHREHGTKLLSTRTLSPTSSLATLFVHCYIYSHWDAMLLNDFKKEIKVL